MTVSARAAAMVAERTRSIATSASQRSRDLGPLGIAFHLRHIGTTLVIDLPLASLAPSLSNVEPSCVKSKSDSAVIDLSDVRVTLSSRAGPVPILRGISLKIERDEAVAIVGPSGSGKTTLMMVMAGLEQATGGRVEVAGETLGAMTEDQLALLRARSIGIVFQSFHLVATMTALENIALPLEFLGRADAFDRAHEALVDVGLAHRQDHFPAQLSGGEQQRVAIARALSPRPQILLADEPTGNLDGATGSHVMDLLFDLREREGMTLVLITHEQALAERCGRILHMQDGRLQLATALRIVAP
jgi:putative ABC transport system ATP-binding protein